MLFCSGMFRCGPAPVAAIKEGNVYCGYDAPFIYAEVNGEYVVWKVDSENTITPVSHMERGVGFHISTKAVGKAERMDITDNYKHPEGRDNMLWLYMAIKWGFGRQKQASRARLSTYIPQNTVGCYYLGMPYIPVPGTYLAPKSLYHSCIRHTIHLPWLSHYESSTNWSTAEAPFTNMV